MATPKLQAGESEAIVLATELKCGMLTSAAPLNSAPTPENIVVAGGFCGKLRLGHTEQAPPASATQRGFEKNRIV
jgi:hypothetical protein